MVSKLFQPGDVVVYRKAKRSTSPGPRAKHVNPSQHGDAYSYTVDKYWIVSKCAPDGTLTLITRRGKEHQLNADDPLLRHPRIWERWLLSSRFPNRQEVEDPAT